MKKQKQQFLHIRIDKKLMKIIDDGASKLGLTMSAYVRMLILESDRQKKEERGEQK